MCNGDDKREKIDFLQKFFAKSFCISFFLLLLSSVLCIVMHDYQLTFVQKYFAMDVDDYNKIVVLIFGVWKVLIIQFMKIILKMEY